jgi:hypothetical protein
MRQLLQRSYKLEIVCPSAGADSSRHHGKTYSEVDLRSKTPLKRELSILNFQYLHLLNLAFPKDGRISFISPKLIVCFPFRHFQQLKTLGLIDKKLHRLAINHPLDEYQLEEVKDNFTG